MVDKPVAVEFFAGAGGLSLGLTQAGFNVSAAVELDPHHAATHEVNFPHSVMVRSDVADLGAKTLIQRAPSLKGGIDLVAGGPPCQGFSEMGRRLVADPRNRMIAHFARLVVELRPRAFLMENVPGILSPRYRGLLDDMNNTLTHAGYRVAEPVVLDASDFGVPQRRRRVFIVGFRGRRGRLPDLAALGGAPAATVWDAIGDLPEVGDHRELDQSDFYEGPLGEPSAYAAVLRIGSSGPLSGCLRPTHSAVVRARFAATPPGGRDSVSRFERLDPLGLACTLRAGTPMERGKYMAPRPIHPVAPRCITVREAARLHSFPDAFQFHGSRWHGFMQVGNSVPPKLGEAVGKALLEAL